MDNLFTRSPSSRTIGRSAETLRVGRTSGKDKQGRKNSFVEIYNVSL